ncbi:hypothetical protein FA09DRAFT_314184 [Tilletiopsis washingtonensis]|uniref:Hypervirulence associated protein TUDOR domain-containing protein n=1 Tax=Tilletiopsis washingtonensis TaxID=58919 RepID=A0A316ZIP2_9BASI|nr:hypothetical protein FA09DRAFT_314184 [Tilletiopsis washingtonensis]PWO01402.1 hypothetical protein FA09DRAFT_314184 [Tilletiopsis washingtonensis]
MPSSKGKPTDPKLREEAKEEVKQMEKGGGKGNWSAYKAAEMAKVYEAKGGGYEDSGDNPNEASKGAPKPKESAVKSGERKDPAAPVGSKKAPASKGKKSDAAEEGKGEGKEKEAAPAAEPKEKETKEKKAPAKEKAPEKEKKEKSSASKEKSAGAKAGKAKTAKPVKEAAKGERTQPRRAAKKAE